METQAYACYLKNKEDLENSSSGGVFTALSNAVFRMGGSVIACNYNWNARELQFDLAQTEDKRNEMRGSKYIQALPNRLYSLLGEELARDGGQPILVVGTPCQIAGAKVWYRNKKGKSTRPVVFCDLLCHGVSSPTLWKEYADEIQQKLDSRIVQLTFKGKEQGWLRPTAKAWLEDGREILVEDYAMLYRSRDFMRESCYCCKFAKEERDTDLTIGDYWNIQTVHPAFANMRGTSNVLVHTELGQWLFQQATNQLMVQESRLEDCIQPALQHPCEKTKRYQDIHKDYDRHGIQYIIEKYVHFGPGNAWVRRIRRKWLRMKYRE